MLDAIGAPIPSAEDPFDKYNTAASPILFPVGERRIGWETRDNGFELFNTHKAIVRVMPGAVPNRSSVRVLGVVGANYKIVHNKELFGHVEDTMRKEIPRDALHGVFVKDQVSNWGRTCFREYLFPNIKCVIGKAARADIAFRLLVQNGYGGSALRVHAGAIDFYCTNGMISGEYHSTYNKHTSGLVVSGIGKTVNNALDAFADAQHRWRRWAETPVRHQEAMELFKALGNTAKLQENLSSQYMREVDVRGNNLWAVYSAMTYYASHADGDFKLRSSVNEQNSEASTMLQRELNVAKWIATPAWRKLERV